MKERRTHLGGGASPRVAGALAVFLLLAAAGGARAQEPAYVLRPAYYEGGRIRTAAELRVELTVRLLVIAPEGPMVHRTRASLGFRRESEDEVLRVVRGRPTEVRRRVLLDRVIEQPPGAPEAEESRTALEGRTLILQETLEGLRVRPEDPSIPLPPDLGDPVIEERLGLALPVEAVRVGDVWRLEGEPFRVAWGEAGGTPDGQLDGRLEGVERDEEGRNVAVVHLSVAAHGSDEQGSRRLSLEGTIRVDIDRRRLLQADLAGTASEDVREEDPSGTSLELHGEGPATLRKTFAYPEDGDR